MAFLLVTIPHQSSIKLLKGERFTPCAEPVSISYEFIIQTLHVIKPKTIDFSSFPYGVKKFHILI